MNAEQERSLLFLEDESSAAFITMETKDESDGSSDVNDLVVVPEVVTVRPVTQTLFGTFPAENSELQTSEQTTSASQEIVIPEVIKPTKAKGGESASWRKMVIQYFR